MAIVFSAAAAFLGLKVGQVFSGHPDRHHRRGHGLGAGQKKNMLGQNVIIQSIGASSGVIVAGAIFTLPALYILGLDAAFWQVFLSSLFGGLLGIVLLIPSANTSSRRCTANIPSPRPRRPPRSSFRARRAARRPNCWPSRDSWADCTTSSSVRSDCGPSRSRHAICKWGAVAADKFKVVFGLNTSAAVLGLGYIIGLKYAMIITAGSCLVWFVIVPVIGSLAEAVDPAAMLSLLGVHAPTSSPTRSRSSPPKPLRLHRQADRHRRHRHGGHHRHHPPVEDHPPGRRSGRLGVRGRQKSPCRSPSARSATSR